jgi:hypothetical protein
MSKDELPEEVKKEINSYVQGLLQKRQQEQDEYNNYVAELQSNGGKIRKSDEATLKRKQRTIERLDNKLERRGFISGQELQVTSRTIEIGSGLEEVHPKAGFNIPPKPFGSGGGVSETASHPFKIRISRLQNANIATVGLGTINSLIPTGLFSGSGLQQYPIPNNSLRFFVLKANSDGSQITSASIEFGGSAAETQQPAIFGLPTNIQFVIGAVYNSQIFQVLFDNLLLSGKQSFVTTKTTPAQAGELPIDVYYVWG